MKFSNHIISRSTRPKFNNFVELSNVDHIKLAKNKSELIVSYDTETIGEEICFSKVCYKTDLSTHFLGVVDGLIEIMHGRPIEAIDRLPAKELDYFLRDDNHTPALSGLGEEFYEILGIGEEIKKRFFKIEADHSPKLTQKFLEMSVSEQLEFIEELCSYYFYNSDSEFKDIEIQDIEDNKLVFSSFKDVPTKKLEDFFSEKLKIGVFVELEN